MQLANMLTQVKPVLHFRRTAQPILLHCINVKSNTRRLTVIRKCTEDSIESNCYSISQIKDTEEDVTWHKLPDNDVSHFEDEDRTYEERQRIRSKYDDYDDEDELEYEEYEERQRRRSKYDYYKRGGFNWSNAKSVDYPSCDYPTRSLQVTLPDGTSYVVNGDLKTFLKEKNIRIRQSPKQ